MAKSTPFGAPLSDAELRLARQVEAAGWASLSQAVKALERGETTKINEWRRRLRQIADAGNR